MEVETKEGEISAIEEHLRESLVTFEREQLRLLTFRRADISDLLASIDKILVQNAAKKKLLL